MPDIRINALPAVATDFASDDYIALDGTTNGTRKLNAKTARLTFADVILGTSGPSVRSSLGARAARQGLVFDGTTDATLNALPAVGTSDWTIAVWGSHSGAPSAYETYIGSTMFGLSLLRAPDGSLEISKTNVAAALNSGPLAWSANKTYCIVATSSAQSYAIYRDGVLVASGGSAQNFTTGINQVGGHINAIQRLYGSVSGCFVYNRALSATEVVALYEQGVPSAADFNNASNTGLLTGNDSTFDSGLGAWVQYGNCTLTNPASNLVISTASGNNGGASIPNKLVVGARYRVVFTASTSLAQAFKVDNNSASVNLTTTPTTYSVEFTATNTGLFLYQLPVSGDRVVTIDNVTLYRIGLLLAPDAAQAGAGTIWYDTSGNGANITLPASGVSWSVPSSRTLGGDWTTSGNLTVSGTGASSVGGNFTAKGTTHYFGADSSQRLELTTNNGSGQGLVEFYNRGTSAYFPARYLASSHSFEQGNATFSGTITTQSSGTGSGVVIKRSSNPYVDFYDGGTPGTIRAEINATNDGVDGGTLLLQTRSAGGTITPALTLDKAGNGVLTGNLTVGGTGTSSVAGNLRPLLFSTTAGVTQTASSATTGVNVGFDGNVEQGWIQATRNSNAETRNLQINPLGGNVLVGTTTDSANGKLQLATHTTSAGGIGFGPSESLFRSGPGTLRLSSTATSAAFRLINSVGTTGLAIEFDNNTGYVWNYQNASLLFGTNNTTALTLDSSQRCILAGALRLNNAYQSGAPTATGYVTLQDSSGNTYKVLVGT